VDELNGVMGSEGSENGSTAGKFLLTLRLALNIASSAASKMTLSCRRPSNITRSSAVKFFLLIFGGRFKNQEASLFDDDPFLGLLGDKGSRRRSVIDALRRLAIGVRL
jgi:hypothetical protein